ncbi:MAG TPA: DinB family protein [Planctomycetota bacterium]|nr:DinB family protein [Planctomycetota bacterium]
MTRKEILLFQLREIRNELAHALEGLTSGQLAAVPVEGCRNPIGWMVCHCMRGLDFFIHGTLTGVNHMDGDAKFAPLQSYADKAPGPENPAPDLSGLAEACDDLWAACIACVEAVDEDDLDRPGPHWSGRGTETVAGNCVRMINHHNAHLRAVWMLRGAMGGAEHYPHQRLAKRPDGAFRVPDRE